MKSGYKQTDVKRKVHQAMRCLMKNDRDLLSVDANERSLTHRLAVYLEQVFPNYHVGCEYNRNHELPKRLKTFQKTVPSNDLEGTSLDPNPLHLLDLPVWHRDLIRFLGNTFPKVFDQLQSFSTTQLKKRCEFSVHVLSLSPCGEI